MTEGSTIEAPTFEKNGIIVIGIDPGASNTGVCVIDGNVPIIAGTFFINKETKEIARDYAHRAKDECLKIIERVKADHPNALVAVEGVVPPQTHMRGKVSFINPKYLVNLGFIVGLMFGAIPDAIRIRPGGNGSQPKEFYPPSLSGVRKATEELETFGKGVRDHEKSAYDVALAAAAGVDMN